MSTKENQSDQAVWVCSKCNIPLEAGKVLVSYLENAFPVELPKCKNCGQSFLSEKLALGKMAEVERMLEDK